MLFAHLEHTLLRGPNGVGRVATAENSQDGKAHPDTTLKPT